MIQLLSRGICFLVFFSLTQWASALSYTVEVPKQVIEDQISLHMPLEKKLPLAVIRLSEPKLELLEASNEVSLFLNVDVVMLKGFKGAGRGELVGSVDYRPEEGAFYLVNPRIVNLSIDHVPGFVMPQISQAARLLLERSLAGYPIYRLDENDPKHKMAKASLKKVSVSHDTLLLTLGLP
jgi:hypothetical protein|tara:strand:- start:862 stop:1401 length:540 start_codon:yes stop_codon:yes gene_type:complete